MSSCQASAAARARQADVGVDGDVIEWGYEDPRGTTRYRIHISDGRWEETGEFSPDGTSWYPFLGMTLFRLP